MLAGGTPWEIARSRCPVGDDALAISYGLWLNLDRQEARGARRIATGMAMALGGKVPIEVYEKLTGSRAAAEELAYASYRSRREQRILSRRGFL